MATFKSHTNVEFINRKIRDLGILLPIIFSMLVLSLLPACKHSFKKSGLSAGKDDVIAVPGSSMQSTTEIHLNDEQIRLGNIRVDTIRSGNIGESMVLSGTLNFNQQKLSTVSTRVEGRIEKLYIRKTGDYVHKGEPLYDLYSEPLNNAKQEYVTAKQEQSTIGNSLINYGAIVEAAKGKLVLWGMTTSQITQLSENMHPSTTTTFFSPEAGYVATLNVQEGGYAMEGAAVMLLADLSTLWAEAQVYTTQLSSLDENSQVTVQIPDLGNQLIRGTISFVNPEINPDTRINLVRATIQNPNNQLRPGMPVYIIAKNRTHHAITLPVDAVLTDSKGSTVWVQTKPGTFSIRMISTGISDENTIEIKSGLRVGDIIVSSGAYLLNSEYIFENGNNPMAGMKM
jgi:membrane fusion protein, copper/silver efflux system